jgi:hypothetical protein
MYGSVAAGIVRHIQASVGLHTAGFTAATIGNCGKDIGASLLFSQGSETGSAGLQTGCLEGLQALRSFAKP